MREPSQTNLNLSDPVSLYPDRQSGISWPLPVDVKLEEFLRAARAAGERTSRRELAAAIIGLAEFDAEELSALLRRYRLAHVGDMLRPPESSNVVSFTAHRPGPRPRKRDP